MRIELLLSTILLLQSQVPVRQVVGTSSTTKEWNIMYRILKSRNAAQKECDSNISVSILRLQAQARAHPTSSANSESVLNSSGSSHGIISSNGKSMLKLGNLSKDWSGSGLNEELILCFWWSLKNGSSSRTRIFRSSFTFPQDHSANPTMSFSLSGSSVLDASGKSLAKLYAFFCCDPGAPLLSEWTFFCARRTWYPKAVSSYGLVTISVRIDWLHRAIKITKEPTKWMGWCCLSELT